ncbi:MAG TPA: putative toxin-antitoxin system toxin component, PIN family [Gaiellaceae bacterium]|nr:putative toxin-antitoxin system toxin component, PIN family [Gaiellaceae bacterium]
MTRAVLDASVFVAAAIRPHGTPAACVRAFAEGRYELIVSPLLLAELRDVLRRARFHTFLTPDQAERLVDALGRDALVEADPPDRPPVSRDRGDDYLGALARAAGAHVLVSGDADLLALDLPDLRILPPREFLELLPS